MRSKFFLLTTVLVLAFALAACGPAAGQARTLTVSAVGTVTLAPDIAYVFIGVQTDNADIGQAVSSNNTLAQAVVAALQNNGVDAKDIQTSNFSVYTNQNFDKLTGQQISGVSFTVNNTVSVTVRDLGKLGSLLDAAIKAGANNINSVSFDVADKTAAMAQARQKAMDGAKSLGAEIAKTASLNLGAIQTISYGENGVTPFYGYGMGGGGNVAAPAAQAAPISPGQIQLTATVTVTYFVK
jgi:hypothetical protein